MNNHKINPATDALIIVDMQNDFCPGGALPVSEGDTIASGIRLFAQAFNHVVFTQDWHPANHTCFADNMGLPEYTQVQLDHGPQTLWPVHCVQGTRGAEVVEELKPLTDKAFVILRKGMNPEVDSYSAFFENNRTSTGLGEMLRARGIERVFCVGLAFDFCVGFTALDALDCGLKSVVVENLCRGIGLPSSTHEDSNSIEDMKRLFEEKGVVLVDADFNFKIRSGPKP